MTPLTESTAEAFVASTCFKIGPPARIGVELEWLVHDSEQPDRAPDPERIAAALAALDHQHPDRGENHQGKQQHTEHTQYTEHPVLPGGSRITREPGGQVELSSPAADGLVACIRTTGADLAALRAAFAAQGLSLVGYGVEPHPKDRQVTLRQPRYLAMEEFFDRAGPWGRIMMCATASTQVCLDAGTEAPGSTDFRERWRLAHRLGPVLVAAFANSPLLDGRPTGYRSARQAVWARMDRTRTQAPGAGDPREAWARYVLDAKVLCVRRADGAPWSAPSGLTFRDWLRRPEAERPTLADLEYHTTTLFPPVRPRGYLELRMIDAQPDDGWIVPAALAAALFADPRATDAAQAALEPLSAALAEPGPRGPAWSRAATRGMADPVLRRAALDCFAAAEAALGRAGVDGGIRSALAAFAERYPSRGRCPADDLLEHPSREDAPC
ncbi:ergothioneine biosynthesis glutamate--cysteine ligase EgtA [Kitasatospora viridis]|uniref:Glutamate--cysteine ligase EgtA n=1 Tax=Kitasatospora viridis TaxID=281105 RepID=A0A561UBG4_9ACTN|nr:ergothioneine biosynthesis glutamate--cysteine ligase EgtA [Kitasatospora viridis]TWF96679.1 glutamate--cysteine ligase [Kitasatospora viridis]